MKNLHSICVLKNAYNPENYKYLELVIKNFAGYGHDLIKASSNGKDVDAQLFIGKWGEQQAFYVNEKPEPFFQYWKQH